MLTGHSDNVAKSATVLVLMIQLKDCHSSKVCREWGLIRMACSKSRQSTKYRIRLVLDVDSIFKRLNRFPSGRSSTVR